MGLLAPSEVSNGCQLNYWSSDGAAITLGMIFFNRRGHREENNKRLALQ